MTRQICDLKLLLKKFIKMVFARFLIGGILNTAITYLLYFSLLPFFSYKIAYTAAFILGILVSYGLNALFVFKAKVAIKSMIRFPLIYLIQYLLGMALVTTLIEYVGVATWLAPMIVIVITVPLTFVLSRLIFTSEK